jgi:hypothetical protein
MAYKRNQIEEAIAHLLDPKSKVVPTELRTRIKRLFELERSLGRGVRSKDPEQAKYAFFSEEAPGTGADIFFSEYESFALHSGLIFIDSATCGAFGGGRYRQRVSLRGSQTNGAAVPPPLRPSAF